MTGPTAVSEAVARFLLATHAHRLAPDPERPWLRRPDPGTCRDCQALVEALGLDGDSR
jgi:hypothetical protein